MVGKLCRVEHGFTVSIRKRVHAPSQRHDLACPRPAVQLRAYPHPVLAGLLHYRGQIEERLVSYLVEQLPESHIQNDTLMSIINHFCICGCEDRPGKASETAATTDHSSVPKQTTVSSFVWVASLPNSATSAYRHQ